MTKQKTPRPVPTFDHLRSAKKPIERREIVAHDDDVHAAYKAASDELRLARTRGRDIDLQRLPALQAAYDAARDELLANSTTFLFRSIGKGKWQALKDLFPATDAQKAAAAALDPPQTVVIDITALKPHAIAAACVEPLMTVEQVQELIRDWNDAETDRLLQHAIDVNESRRVVDLTF